MAGSVQTIVPHGAIAWRRLVGLGVVLCGAWITAGCAHPGRVNPSQAWFVSWTGEGIQGRRITTAHFEIISTVVDDEFERGLPGFLERAYAEYEKTLPGVRPVDERLTTYVFGLRDEWTRFTRTHYPLRLEVYARIRSGGFTEGTTAASFYVSRGVTLATLAHEGWHQYVNARVDRPIPAWINEGLACTFESFDLDHGAPRFKPRRNAFRINSLREAIQRDTLIPLAEMLDTDAGEVILSDRTKNTDTYYAQAWALITFLRYGAGGRYASAFKRMMGDVASGSFHVRISAARLTSADKTYGAMPISDGRAAFVAYFDTAPEDVQEDYYDHLVRKAGFFGG